MFETLEAPNRPVGRAWPLFMYATYCVGGLVFVALSVSRHGLSEPIRLALSGLMFALSLVWLVATLKTETPVTSRDMKYRGITLLLLLMGLDALSLFR